MLRASNFTHPTVANDTYWVYACNNERRVYGTNGDRPTACNWGSVGYATFSDGQGKVHNTFGIAAETWYVHPLLSAPVGCMIW